VTLRGQTVGKAQKSQASAYAREVPGVLRVDNRMTVAGTEASVTSSSIDEMDDAGSPSESRRRCSFVTRTWRSRPR